MPPLLTLVHAVLQRTGVRTITYLSFLGFTWSAATLQVLLAIPIKRAWLGKDAPH
jgi:hypothetical protein